MTTFLTIAGLFIVGGMAFAFGIARMADKPAPKPPLRLVRTDGQPMTERETAAVLDIIRFDAEMRGYGPGPYESSTVHGYRVPPTTDDRGLQ